MRSRLALRRAGGAPARPRRLASTSSRPRAAAARCWARRCASASATRRSCAAPAPTSGRSCASAGSTARGGRGRCAASDLLVAALAAPPLGEDECWAEDLEGCAVTDGDRAVGRVRRLVALPSCDVLEVERDGGGRPAGPDGARRDPLGRRRGAAHRRRRCAFLGERARGGAGSTSSRSSPSGSTGSGPAPRAATPSRTAPSCATSTPATHTPLSGGQVDDTPFGGGAGMVLRVDVMDAALRAFYGVDPRRPSQPAPRDRADAGRADARRGLRRRARRGARASRCCAAATRASTSASSSTSPRTRCRSGATCCAAASWRRWSSWTPCCASCPARSDMPTARVEESFSAALEGQPEYPHYTRPARIPRLEGARRAALRTPRGDPHVAADAQPRARVELTRSSLS